MNFSDFIRNPYLRVVMVVDYEILLVFHIAIWMTKSVNIQRFGLKLLFKVSKVLDQECPVFFIIQSNRMNSSKTEITRSLFR